MSAIENYNVNIQLALKKLIDLKSKQDQNGFSMYQLAKAIDMPHSMLVKLLHTNPDKRVNNPRINTLTKITEFFQKEGFNITIDDILSGLKNCTIEEVDSQQLIDLKKISIKSVPLYSMLSNLENKIGNIDIRMENDSSNVIALLSDQDIKPIFRKGSIFLIDKDTLLENDMLVAIKLKNDNKILIGKYYVKKNINIIEPLGNNHLKVELKDKNCYDIVGAVIQINVAT